MQSLAPAFPARAEQVLGRLSATERPALWLADRVVQAASAAAVRPTGFAALDAELPGGGWPAAGLTELLLAAPGSGELRLLAPSLAQQGQHSGSLLCIASPFAPYAPALHALGWPLERLLLVMPESLADAAWAAEQALRSGACAAVLWWQGEGRSAAAVLSTALRRLHLAAQEGACPLWALRPAAARAQSSPAPLRLALEPGPQGQLGVQVFKRRGPAMAAPLWLSLPMASLPARRVLRQVPAPMALPAPPSRPALTAAPAPAAAALSLPEPAHAVVCAAPERAAA